MTDEKHGSFRETVAAKEARKLRARQHKRRSVWCGLSMFGMVGWSVAVPTLLGVLVGLWLDRRWPGPVSWTITLLGVGVALGCVHAWYWVQQEHRRP